MEEPALKRARPDVAVVAALSLASPLALPLSELPGASASASASAAPSSAAAAASSSSSSSAGASSAAALRCVGAVLSPLELCVVTLHAHATAQLATLPSRALTRFTGVARTPSIVTAQQAHERLESVRLLSLCPSLGLLALV